MGDHSGCVPGDGEKVGGRVMPHSTKFMMACVLAVLAGISVAAGTAISYQKGPCEIRVIDGSAWRKGVVGLHHMRSVCD